MQNHNIANKKFSYLTKKPILSFLILFITFAAHGQNLNGGQTIVKYFTAASIQGNHAGENPVRRLTIYVPPGYDQSSKRYPVIYLLHGYGGDDSTTNAEINFKDLLDTAIVSGHMRPVILVLPNSYTKFKGSFYSNSTFTGNWADFIAKDVVGFVDKNFRTIPERNSRGLSGISMGGHGALKIGMLFPNIFGSIYAMTPAMLNWSDGNNIGIPAFKFIANVKTKEDVFQNYRATLMVNLGRTYSPNENKPPFYADMPTYYIGDSIIVDNSIVKKWETNFPTTMIETYVAALKSFKAIKLDWGRNDDERHVPTTCLEFSKKLERYGIKHFAEEYLGGHAGNLEGIEGRIYTEVLPFFDTYLKSTDKIR